jgi:hypothetical protein
MRKGRPRGDRPEPDHAGASVRPRASVAKQLRPCLRLARRQLVPHRRHAGAARAFTAPLQNRYGCMTDGDWPPPLERR